MKHHFCFQTILSHLKCLSIIYLILLTLNGCGFKRALPVIDTQWDCHSVDVADGPEDFVLDDFSFGKRLIISSHDRRNFSSSGGIFALDIPSETVIEMNRIGEPEKIKAFKPHGMDIRYDETGSYLYVILHDLQNQLRRDNNAIAVYKIGVNSLTFVSLFENKRHLWSPNDLSVMQSGEIYVTNDVRTTFDLYFKRDVSEVVRYQPELNQWSVVASGIGFANGILALPDTVYVATSFDNKLLIFKRSNDGSLKQNGVVGPIKGMDNLMPFGRTLITTAHFDDLAFMRHMKSRENISPSVVFIIDPDTKTFKPVYTDTGVNISAASTAMFFDKKLYISQVFDSHLRICQKAERK